MRRFLIAGAVVLCLLLGGCASPKVEAKDLDFQFDCKAEIQYPEGSATCVFQRTGPKNALIEIVSGGPEGLCWSWSGNSFSLLYQGLSATGQTCVLPQDSFAFVLVHTLDQAQQTDDLTPTHDNEFSGNAGYDYTLTADPATGKILTLNVPECGVKAEFYDYAQKAISTELNLGGVHD
ncbi:MAG: hypothetical protein LKJ17_00280 [Oscillospiraceae bacterium]|nr:hypothetical protein [Oscillospiraceae bacterium]